MTAGVEYYFGYSFACNDLNCEDYRSRANMWDQSRYALEFFKDNNISFWDMSNDNTIISNGGRCLVESNGETIVAFLPTGTATIDIAAGNYAVEWYDPRNGGSLQSGSVMSVSSGSNRSLGSAPNNAGQDWVVLLRRSEASLPTQGPSTNIFNPPTSPTAPPVPQPTPAPPTPTFGSVTGFTLVDAATNMDIGPLNTGDTVNLADVGNELNIRADVTGSIGSVGFALDGNGNYRTENFAVYALGGDLSGDYKVVTELTDTGSHTVTATPYSGKSKSGNEGAAASITFTVV